MPSLKPGKTGREYWRSLDELTGAPEFQNLVAKEFPFLEGFSDPSRRSFLKLMGASLALGGLVGCRWPREEIVPYAKRPMHRIPGVPVYFATTHELGGVGTGVLVKSYDGRPIKVEGNPQHPGSLGATSAYTQASVLEMYDPDRSTAPREKGAPRTWADFDAFAGKFFASLRATGGEGFVVLAEPSSSPTRAALRERLAKAMPKMQWVEWTAISRDNERSGLAKRYGQPVRPRLNLEKARVIASFDSDFLMTHPDWVRHTRDFARGRVAFDQGMSRLYVYESTLSLTGTNADERHAVRSRDIPGLLLGLLAALNGLPAESAPSGPAAESLADLAKDLMSHRGAGLVTVGPRQPAEVHALCAAINEAIGALGETIAYIEAPDADRPSHNDAMKALVERMKAGGVSSLLMLGENPVYTAPRDLGFAEALKKIDTSIHLSLYADETSAACRWHLPAAHYLEAWGDARSWDGVVSLQQPLIDPLFGGRSSIEVLAALAGDELRSGYDLVRRTHHETVPASADFESTWRRWLHDGVIADTAWPTANVRPSGDNAAIAGALKDLATAGDQLEVVFTPDYKLYDGRFANNAWLQEMPDPITKNTWDNAALISVHDAERWGVRRDDILEITLGATKLLIPAHPVPGHARGSITLPLGYGRTGAGVVGHMVGFDTYTLRSAAAPDIASGASVRKAGGSHMLMTTQDHHAITTNIGLEEIQERVPSLLREGALSEYKADPHFVRRREHKLPLTQLFGDKQFPERYQWGMAIDLSKCTGCSACVVACQAENNVPVVGRDEVRLGREMHWLRVDRYFLGDPADESSIRVRHQPMPCQHCENAPCEQVCPVAATVHDQEGLNVMVYNRCIGTRYCSNNCPYKVRRFNWFYNHHGPKHPRSITLGKSPWPATPARIELTPLEEMGMNPDVTVRARGVMEKCTFCVQRISAGKIHADNEHRELSDGEVVTACQQACPAEAIMFGRVDDPNSRVRQWHGNERAYEALELLNVRPRNRYLARVTNPAHEPAGGHGGHGAHGGAAHGHAG